MSEKEEFFNYVANVLGVKSLYLDAADMGSANLTTIHAAVGKPDHEANVQIPLLIKVEGLSTYLSEEKDLLEKMVAALKIDLNKIKIVDLNAAVEISASFEVLFLDEVSSNVVGNTSEATANPNQLFTLSPRLLTKKPQLKKQVWGDLQKVIQFFS